MMNGLVSWATLTVIAVFIGSLCGNKSRKGTNFLRILAVVIVLAIVSVVYVSWRQEYDSTAGNGLFTYWLCRFLWKNEVIGILGGGLSGLVTGYAVNYIWKLREVTAPGQSIWKPVAAALSVFELDKNGNRCLKGGKQLLWRVTVVAIIVLIVLSNVVYHNSAVMPDLMGESFSDARHMLKEAGFVSFSLISEDGMEEGTVVEQDYAVGTVLGKSNQIFQVVMEVPETISVIYLFSEYKQLAVLMETEITATLNFDARAVSISAYLNGVQSGDTVQMSQSDPETWKVKVYFEEIGSYEVVATAIMADGAQVEETMEIEVIEVASSIITDIFENVSEMFGTGNN